MQTDAKVLEPHGTQSDQCMKPIRVICKFVCVFSTTVMLLMALVGAGKVSRRVCCDLCTQALY